MKTTLALSTLGAGLIALGACSSQDNMNMTSMIDARPGGGDIDAHPGGADAAPPSPDGPPVAGAGWHAIDLPLGQQQNRVTGIACTSANACVIATEQNLGDPGQLIAANDHAVGDTLINGADLDGLAHLVIGDV